MQTVLTAFIMRHAEAVPQRPGERDFDRPLLARGADEASAMGRWLRTRMPGLAAVLSSPARRARMTTEAVLAAWDETPPPVTWSPALYLAELPVLVESLEQAEASPILLVGHNPGLEELVQYLFPGGEIGMSTAALCALEVRTVDGRISRGAGTLQAHMRPDRL